MARRKEPQIPDAILDQLLSGTAASAAFDQGVLLDQLKKALEVPLQRGAAAFSPGKLAPDVFRQQS